MSIILTTFLYIQHRDGHRVLAQGIAAVVKLALIVLIGPVLGALGAAFAGFAGSFFAARQGLVTPESFTFIESAIILAIVVLGGMGSQLGVILAAVVMILLPEMMREFSEYRMLMFGALMVLMMIWRPQGLLPMQRPHMELRK
jgi:branched-chain amino acid transport system permease protein